MNQTRALFALSLGLAAAMPAQSAPSRTLADAPADVSLTQAQVAVERASDGVVWAATPAWKAAFDAAGATFLPFVGAQQPARSVRFALQAATLAGKELPLTAAAAELQTRRIVFARGAVTEFYDLLPQGLEQQFELRSLPERGELRLRIAVATTMPIRIHGNELVFGDATGGARYGAATVFDAQGRSLGLATTWLGEALELTVPAAFVQAAALPLRIDPLIDNAVPQAPSAAQLLATDMAYDHSLDRFFVSYERAFSATDHDVYVAVLSASMQLQTLVTIDYTSQYWTGPRLATLAATDSVAVVAQVSVANAAPFEIRSRAFTGGANPVLGPVHVVAGSLSGNHFDPDIGGDAQPTGSPRFLAAWETRTAAINSTTIHYCHLSPDGSPWASRFVSTGIGFVRGVQVSKTRGRSAGNDGWALVFRADSDPPVSGRLELSYVNRDATIRSVGCCDSVAITPMTTNFDNQWTVSSPTEAGGRTFLVAESRYDFATGRSQILGQVLDDAGSVLVPSTTLVGGLFDRRRPVADSDGCRFVLASQTVFSGTDVDVRASLVARVGNQMVVQETVFPATSTAIERNVCVCAAIGKPNQYGIGWTLETGGLYTLHAQGYHALGSGGFNTRVTGCGGLSITAVGWPGLGETFTVHRTSADGLGGFLGGLPVTLPVPGCAGCLQGVDGDSFLGSELHVTVPCHVGLVGIEVAFQAFRFAAGTGACLGQIRLSNTLGVVVQ